MASGFEDFELRRSVSRGFMKRLDHASTAWLVPDMTHTKTFELLGFGLTQTLVRSKSDGAILAVSSMRRSEP